MKHNRNLTFLFMFGFGCSAVFAQESVNSSGGDASGSGGTVSYTIGQVAYENQTGTNGNINQGVQQPYEIYSLGISDTEIEIQLSIYPNPTSDQLHILFKEFTLKEVAYRLSDQTGRVVAESPIDNATTFLNLSQFETGIYTLNITSGSNTIKTFKIVKN